MSDMKAGVLYSNIFVYRAFMNVLYRGHYRQRFEAITNLLQPRPGSVCELCFGDTMIAAWCRGQGIRWSGVDRNHGFCVRARRRGFDVFEGDLLAAPLPPADVYVIAGSLYHFHDRVAPLFDAMRDRTARLIVSEPVRNLTSQHGVVGRLASWIAHPGDRPANFRYDAETLLDAIREQQHRCGFTFTVVATGRDMLVDIRFQGGVDAPTAAP